MPGNLIENGSPQAAQTKADNTRCTVSENPPGGSSCFRCRRLLYMRMALGTFRASKNKKKIHEKKILIIIKRKTR